MTRLWRVTEYYGQPPRPQATSPSMTFCRKRPISRKLPGTALRGQMEDHRDRRAVEAEILPLELLAGGVVIASDAERTVKRGPQSKERCSWGTPIGVGRLRWSGSYGSLESRAAHTRRDSSSRDSPMSTATFQYWVLCGDDASVAAVSTRSRSSRDTGRSRNTRLQLF
jgi:hypothetical protein